MTASEQIAQAEALYRSGEADRAEAIGVAILQADPGHVAALSLIEEIAFDRGVFTEAIGRMRAGAAANPAEPTVPYKLGCLLATSRVPPPRIPLRCA